MQDYNDIFKEQLAHHITEKNSEDELKQRNDIGKVHFIPHSPVIKEERETTKVRIVFDVSSKIIEAVVRRCSSKYVFLKISQYLQENMCWSVFSILKRDSNGGVFL